MDNTDRLELMMETLTELTEEKLTRLSTPAPDRSSLQSALTSLGSLPDEALFLGIAEDGLPVLLNLYDPIPGPILIIGDQASGKTSLLQMIASAAEYLHTPTEVQYGVITPDPNEWNHLQNGKINAGIYSVNDTGTAELLQSLETWAHNNKGDQQSILLLIDNLEEIIKISDQAKQNLRWLLLRGPSRRVWPIVTLNASHAKELNDWMEFFHTRLFGHIQQPDDAQSATGVSNSSLNKLARGTQFSMREGDKWLNFRVPPPN
jgi:hypothetical protein